MNLSNKAINVLTGERLLKIIDSKIASIKARPLMFGDLHSVEMQWLLLLEMKQYVLEPELNPEEFSSFFQQFYSAFLRDKLPRFGPLGLVDRLLMKVLIEEDEPHPKAMIEMMNLFEIRLKNKEAFPL